MVALAAAATVPLNVHLQKGIFWHRYGITITEDDGIYYAAIKGGGSLHAGTLTKMWEKLGDRFVQVSAL